MFFWGDLCDLGDFLGDFWVVWVIFWAIWVFFGRFEWLLGRSPPGDLGDSDVLLGDFLAT